MTNSSGDGSGGGSWNNDGYFVDSTGASSDPRDYATKDWKWIEAAIVGGSGLTPGHDGAEVAKGFADPQTLIDAAAAFYAAQKRLEMISASIKNQAEALAGQDGAWKGASADSFLRLMETLSQDIAAKAAQLGGGASGADSVPEQLWNNAGYLRWAQNTIKEIDSFYAAQAIALGHQFANGLAHVADLPNFVAAMTENMRTVAGNLAQNYQVTVDNVVVPKPIDGGAGGTPPPPNVPGPHNIPDPGPGLPPPPDANLAPPPTPTPGPPPSLGPLPDPGPVQNFSATPPPFGADSGGGGVTPNPFPGGSVPGGDLPGGGLTGLAGPNGGPSGDVSGVNPLHLPDPLSGPGGDSGLLANPGGDLGALPSGLPGSLGGPGGLAAGSDVPGKSPTSFPGSLSGPGAPGKSLFADTSPVDAPSALGGLRAAGGLSAPNGGLSGLHSGAAAGSGVANGAGAGDASPVSFPESLSGPGVGAQQQVGGAGLPLLPGGLGGGGAAGGQPGAERPDAAGLLGGVSAPWAGEDLAGLGEPGGVPVDAGVPADWAGSGGVELPGGSDVTGVQSVGAPDGLVPEVEGPGVGAQQQVGGAGLPLLPGGLGGGGAAGGQPGAERPDAAGLLGGLSEFWVVGGFGRVGEPGGVPVGAGVPADWADDRSGSLPLDSDASATDADPAEPEPALDVACVSLPQPSEDVEDTTAWDSVDVPFLPAFLPLTTSALTTSALANTYQRKRHLVGTPEVDEGLPPMCSTAEPSQDEPDSGSDSGSDVDVETIAPEPRTVADLLSQDFGVWRRDGSTPSGVLD